MALTSSMRNTFGCNLVDLHAYDIAIAKQVGIDRGDELGVQTSIG
jgi:hypothetical protein